jgi:predicted MFS family arabinose efflux permease
MSTQEVPVTRLSPRLLAVLIHAALSTSIVSSLGMLLVPTISREFDTTISSAQWMLTVNLLVGAISTPIMGRLSDGPHKKRLLLISLGIILAGSIIAALATDFTLFLVGRGLQGLTYGIVPVTIAMARRYLPEAKVGSAISSLSVTVATGIGIGYPLTGIVARFVPAGPDTRALIRAFDYIGASLLGLGLGTMLVAISEGPNWGWGSPWTVGAFIVAAILLAVWSVAELRTDHPLINLRVLRHGEVLLANLAAIGLGTAMYIGFSIASLIAQAPTETGYGIGMPVFWAGFVMLPLSVGSFGANRLVRLLARRIRLATLLPVGAGVMTASTILLFTAHNQLWEILVGMLLFGVGIGTTYAAMPGLIARSIAAEELGSAVSFNQVLRTVGGSFGSAISGAVLAAHLSADAHPSDAGISISLAIGSVGCVLVFIALLIHYLRDRRQLRLA